jgi:hypothetical protein
MQRKKNAVLSRDFESKVAVPSLIKSVDHLAKIA